MKKIIAFAGSNSSTSINHKLVSFVASELGDHDINVLRLTDYPLPIFGEDLEKVEGYPSNLELLLSELKQADAFVISVNEHNGTVSAFFKNVMDWLSRIEYKFLAEKKILLMSVSPGKRGALSAYEYTKGVLPRFGGEVVAGFNFPSFYENFSEENQKINDTALETLVGEAKTMFLESL